MNAGTGSWKSGVHSSAKAKNTDRAVTAPVTLGICSLSGRRLDLWIGSNMEVRSRDDECISRCVTKKRR